MVAAVQAPPKAHKPQFLAEQRLRLLKARKELANQLGGLGAMMPQVDRTEGNDFADRASQDAEADLQFSLSERSHETLRELDQALSRIVQGTYGVCEITGELIPEARLRALPFARNTVNAQRALERNSYRSRSYGASFDDAAGETEPGASE